MNLGEFEHIVLLVVLRLADEAYAIPIREEIERRTGRAVARGALYTALERLETKRCLRSKMSDPLPERGGRSRRYFTVTATGHGRDSHVEAQSAAAVAGPRGQAGIMTAPQRPPRLAERLLAATLGRGEWAESILGDLHEEYRHYAEFTGSGGGLRAGAWYWAQSLRLAGRSLSSAAAGLPFTIQRTLAAAL